ncbi:proteasome assembly chaperone 4 [Abrus precatorius]|uniref:Proteasome assembly chaperone 4 n=1 Tax=Abrus precatorius TaxID=3816 RepID=A0A8B8K5U5_ABRPR|nr:proteasome assembly chaperone 4 [Abrus precatorius]
MDSEGLERGIEELKLQEKGEVHALALGQLQVTSFSELVNDVSLHFQIIRFPKQIYVWVGYNSAKLGHMYAAATTRPNNMVSVTSILGVASDNTGSGIANRLVLKTGLNIILACNIPKNSPMLEIEAEKILVQKLISLGYTNSRLGGTSL